MQLVTCYRSRQPSVNSTLRNCVVYENNRLCHCCFKYCCSKELWDSITSFPIKFSLLNPKLN